MAKKILTIALIAIVAVSAAACFAACEEEPTPYADLVAVRVNNFMAEWENIDYNFTYEGSSALKVSVPYTNYLEVNDLIVSPGAEYKVYEDEGKTKQLTDLSEIYVDGTKTLYIDVTNGELSNSYSVDVTVEQTNLPPESEIADKQYDNRGGHIYIPEGAETVVIDGEEYTVLRRDLGIEEDQNYIFAEDRSMYAGKTTEFNGVLDGNNYNLSIKPSMVELPLTGKWEDATWYLHKIGHQGVVKNIVMEQPEDYGQGEDGHVLYKNYDISPICKDNYGTIENVYSNYKYFALGYGAISASAFIQNNYGTMENCLVKGSIYGYTYERDALAAFSAFAYSNSGKMKNCVNMSDISNPTSETEHDMVGAASIVFSSRDGSEYIGVFNLGKVEMAEGNGEAAKKAYDNMFFAQGFDTPNMGRMKNYR